MSISRLMGDLNFYREPRNSQVDDAKVRSVESRLSRWRSASSACCIVVCKTCFLSIGMDRYRELGAKPNSPLSDGQLYNGEHYLAARLGFVTTRDRDPFLLVSRKSIGMKVELWRKCAFLSVLQLLIQGSLSEIFSTINDDRKRSTSCQPILINAIVN